MPEDELARWEWAVSMADLQQSAHGEGHDYAAGSPHIRHHALRSTIVATLQDVVGEVLEDRAACSRLAPGTGSSPTTWSPSARRSRSPK